MQQEFCNVQLWRNPAEEPLQHLQSPTQPDHLLEGGAAGHVRWGLPEVRTPTCIPIICANLKDTIPLEQDACLSLQRGVVGRQLEEKEERRHKDHLPVRDEGFLRHGVHHGPCQLAHRAVVPWSVGGPAVRGVKVRCGGRLLYTSSSCLVALTASESDGSLVIEQYAPCPLCASLGQQNRANPSAKQPAKAGAGDGAGDVYYFNMEDCVLAAVLQEHIVCPRHPDRPVPLQELVPELFMTDFPTR